MIGPLRSYPPPMVLGSRRSEPFIGSYVTRFRLPSHLITNSLGGVATRMTPLGRVTPPHAITPVHPTRGPCIPPLPASTDRAAAGPLLGPLHSQLTTRHPSSALVSVTVCRPAVHSVVRREFCVVTPPHLSGLWTQHRARAPSPATDTPGC